MRKAALSQAQAKRPEPQVSPEHQAARQQYLERIEKLYPEPVPAEKAASVSAIIPPSLGVQLPQAAPAPMKFPCPGCGKVISMGEVHSCPPPEA